MGRLCKGTAATTQCVATTKRQISTKIMNWKTRMKKSWPDDTTRGNLKVTLTKHSTLSAATMSIACTQEWIECWSSRKSMSMAMTQSDKTRTGDLSPHWQNCGMTSSELVHNRQQSVQTFEVQVGNVWSMPRFLQFQSLQRPFRKQRGQTLGIKEQIKTKFIKGKEEITRLSVETKSHSRNQSNQFGLNRSH